MKKIILTAFFLEISILLSGCAATYPAIEDGGQFAIINFERKADAPLLGSSTVFVHIDDEYECKATQGFMGQQIMARLDKGNPLVSSFNESGLRIEIKENFRILVRNVAGLSRCDTVLGFKTVANIHYKLLSTSDLSSLNDAECSVEIFQKESSDNTGEYTKIELNEYESCSYP